MGCVWRPQYHDKKTGERKQQRVYHAKFNLERGEPWIRKSTGQTDRRAAERRMAEMIEEERQLRAGVSDPALLHRRKTLDDHVADFEDEMRGTDDTPAYLNEFMNNLRQILGFVPTRTLAGLPLFKLRHYLESDAVKAKPRENWKTAPEGDISHRSINKRIKALKQFGRWLEDTGRIPKSPFRRLRCLNEATDPRRERTVFTPDQYEVFRRAASRRPLADAQRNRVNKGVTPEQRKKLRRLGQVRALAYDMAHEVGLRRNEVVVGTRADYDLAKGAVRVQARIAKARRTDELPIEGRLLRRLRAYVRTRPDIRPHDRMFTDERGRTLVPDAKTLRADLAFAGISRTNEREEVLDFHALRTSFITDHANKGTHPLLLKKLARHAKLDTTDKYYTRINLEDLRREIEREVPDRPEPAHGAGRR